MLFTLIPSKMVDISQSLDRLKTVFGFLYVTFSSHEQKRCLCALKSKKNFHLGTTYLYPEERIYSIHSQIRMTEDNCSYFLKKIIDELNN